MGKQNWSPTDLTRTWGTQQQEGKGGHLLALVLHCCCGPTRVLPPTTLCGFRTLPLSLPFLRKCLIPPGSKQTWGALTTLNSQFMDTSGRYSCLSYKSGLQRGLGMVLPRLCLAALKPRLLPFLWASLGRKNLPAFHTRRSAFPLAHGRQSTSLWP